jgi:hypothetical protein
MVVNGIIIGWVEETYRIVMNKLFLLIIIFLSAILLNSCSKKSHPSRTTADSEKKSTKTETVKTPAVVKKEAKKPEAVFPKVITVNDSAAHKSVDGRMYYDVMGHRYWRNNKDGKYYLFNKSMYNNPDFKAQN